MLSEPRQLSEPNILSEPHIIILRVRVTSSLHMPSNQLGDGLVDLMRPESIEGSVGIGAEWRIPVYRYSESPP
jgi:hypothetical protein